MPATARQIREISGNKAMKQRNGREALKGSPAATTAIPYAIFTPNPMPETIILHYTSASEAVSTPSPKTHSDDSIWICIVSSRFTSRPAIILNELYRSYLEVDHAIRPTGDNGGQYSKASQQELDISSYFASPRFARHWQSGIETLTQQYFDGILTQSGFTESLERIMTAVERLEEVQATVEHTLKIELEKCGIPVNVPESFWAFLEARSRTLEIASMSLESRLEE